MTDLLRTVRERYSRGHGFGGLFTLSYRTRSRCREHGERLAREALRWEILQSAGRDMLRHTRHLKSQISASEARWLESSRRTQRGVELFFAQTGRTVNEVKRQAGRIAAREEERRRAAERIPPQERPITLRDARLLLDERIMKSGEQQMQARRQASENMRAVMRRLREEENYEQRRKGSQ